MKEGGGALMHVHFFVFVFVSEHIVSLCCRTA